MRATGYPQLALHRMEHQWLAEQVSTLKSRTRHSVIDVIDHLAQLLTQSHTGHMQKGDAHYGRWLSNPLPPAGADHLRQLPTL